MKSSTTEIDFEAFRDPGIAKALLDSIFSLVDKAGSIGKTDSTGSAAPVRLMEVCGTHTMSIARAGIRSLLPEGVKLTSGPGCPVCVTSNADIDKAIALSRLPGIMVASFGDMLRVPGSTSSLMKERAAGAKVQVVYSPLDALALAQADPDTEVVFIGVGFETTAPLTAKTIERAAASGIKNFSVLCLHKNMPGAIEAIVSDPALKVDALILPGHVSTIIGSRQYAFLAKKYGIPGVITGFEPNDILQGIAMILRQLHDGRAEIEIAYLRGVRPEGNPAALSAMGRVFKTVVAEWRGLGQIEGSGYAIRDEFAGFDAMRRFGAGLTVEQTKEHPGCMCADVLRGVIEPPQCPLFKVACTPEDPVGPCMVSTEGTCAAFWRYY